MIINAFGLTWHFQEVIEAQDKTITNLLNAVKEQHDQLDHQKMKIKNLEEKVNNNSLLSPVSDKL